MSTEKKVIIVIPARYNSSRFEGKPLAKILGKPMILRVCDLCSDTLEKVASFKPDIILLDIMMPKLSGFEVCQQLKADPTTRHIMVLMVTALGELGDIERAVEAGTDDFLSKPVNKIELVKRVENMLKLRHVSDELQRLRSYISSMDNDLPPRQVQS